MACRMVERPPLGLVVLEIGQPVEPGAQVSGAERAFEAGPARGLGVLVATERVEHLDPCVLPIEARPVPWDALGRVERLQRLVRATRGQQSPGNLGRDVGSLPRRAVILFDEAVDVALEIRDLPQGEANGGRPAARPDLVGVDGPASAPGEHPALVRRRFRDGRSRQLEEARLEMVETLVPQKRREGREQRVVLAVAVVVERGEDAIGQRQRVGLRALRQRAEIAAGGVEDVAELTVAVVATLVRGVRQLQEAPHQVEGLAGIDIRHLVDDGTALRLEIGGERPYLVPIEEGTPALDPGELLAHFRRDPLRRLVRSEREAQPALRCRIARGNLQQKLGQALGAQRLEVPGGQCLLRGHRLQGWPKSCVPDNATMSRAAISVTSPA